MSLQKPKRRLYLIWFFARNTILSWFFLFFLLTDLHFLIAVVIAQIFIPVVGLTMPTETPANEANAEIEI